MIIVDYILTPRSHFGEQKDYWFFFVLKMCGFFFVCLFSLIVYQKHANHRLELWDL